MMIGFIGIFILLSFQFRTFSEPVIVMLAIPFYLIGVIWGHGLMASTTLVLLVIPCMYMILGDLGIVEKIQDSGGNQFT